MVKRNALIFKIAATLMLLPAMAFASPTNPPKRFDHAFHGTVHLKLLPQSEVQKICAKLSSSRDLILGCSVGDGKNCIVIITNKPFMGQSVAAVKRHEIGHCNGWNSSHSN